MSLTQTPVGKLTILEPGFHTTIQDQGRQGKSDLGLSQGGPMDLNAFHWCNRLLGNEENAACLEITLGGFKCELSQATHVCLTGAESTLLVNDEEQPSWQNIAVVPGSKIEITMANKGLRCYFNIFGGIDVEPVFGSRSTVIREKLGPNDGQALKAGIEFNYTPIDSGELVGRRLPEIPSYEDEVELRVVLGYQHAWFSDLDKKRFFSSEYQVSNQFDRMGYRLTGASIPCSRSNMLSEGIALGAIQIPADGQPIVLLNDRQTLGGYPKIGSVFQLDLPKLAQCGAGAKIRFTPISMEAAHNEIMLAQYRRDQIQLNSEQM